MTDETRPTLRQRALDLYRPPFRFDGITYIWDSKGEMVCDSQVEGELADLAPRVRGWGRMKYIPGCDELFVATGHAIAEALTIGWEKLRAGPLPEQRPAHGGPPMTLAEVAAAEQRPDEPEPGSPMAIARAESIARYIGGPAEQREACKTCGGTGKILGPVKDRGRWTEGLKPCPACTGGQREGR